MWNPQENAIASEKFGVLSHFIDIMGGGASSKLASVNSKKSKNPVYSLGESLCVCGEIISKNA